MVFRSPSRKASVVIRQVRYANELGMQVQLLSDGRQTNVFESHRETWIYFVHAYWSPDEKVVGVVATGMNYFELAFDTRTGKAAPFSSIQKGTAQSIRSAYNLTNEKDPITWAHLSDAHEAFARLHPEIQLTYTH